MSRLSWMGTEDGGKNSKRNLYLKGVETVRKIVKIFNQINIPIVIFYAFSSENWKRPKSEIEYLLKLIKIYFSKEIKNIYNQGIKLNIFGELNKLAPDIKSVLKKSTNLTQNNKKIIVNLAINYGSKNEILHAIKKSKKKSNLKSIEQNLYTKNMPHPDILIRTGGHKRLSNFMLWQLAYAELFFLNKLWPDFNSSDLLKILKKYKNIKRNFGAI